MITTTPTVAVASQLMLSASDLALVAGDTPDLPTEAELEGLRKGRERMSREAQEGREAPRACSGNGPGQTEE
jgi:hypothetical protein